MITVGTLKRAIKEEGMREEDFDLDLKKFSFKEDSLTVNEWGDVESETIERWNKLLSRVVNRMLSYNTNNCASGWKRHWDSHFEYCFNGDARASKQASYSNSLDQFGYCE